MTFSEYYTAGGMTLYCGDALDVLKSLPDASIQMCVTSPPYWGLRDYEGNEGQIGLESVPVEYIASLTNIFREVRRVLRDDGTLWLNLGDSYAGSGKGRMADGSSARTGKLQTSSKGTISGKIFKESSGLPAKNLVGIPWRVAFALQDDGWILRQDIIWHKPNPMPESVKDRCTKAHEYLFLLSKTKNYHFDSDAIKEPVVSKTVTTETRNKRSVWSITTQPLRDEHFATYPMKLVEPCVLAGSKVGSVVLDPFNGAGTTGLVAKQLDRQYVGIDINSKYLDMTLRRWQREKVIPAQDK